MSASNPGDAQPEPENDLSLPPDDSAAALLADELPTRPVFYNERRGRWFARVMLIFSLITGMALLTLVASLIARPLFPRLPLPKVVALRDLGNPDPNLSDHEKRRRDYVRSKTAQAIESDAQKLRQQEDREAKRLADRRQKAAAFVQQAALTPIGPPTAAPAPIVAGFYVNWEQTSFASAHRNIGSLTHFIPEWLHLKPAGSDFTEPGDASLPFIDGRQIKSDKQDLTPFVRSRNVPILPLINNYTKKKGQEEGAGNWDPDAIHEIVSNPKARTNVITQLLNWCLREQMQGINIDFEQIAPADKAGLVQFMKELYTAFHARNLLVTQDVEIGGDGFDMAGLAKWNDWIVPMFYDQHEAGSGPGPVAGVDWTAGELRKLLRQIPANKVVMGVGNHAYDWTEGEKGADDITFQQAIVIAKDNQPDPNDPTSDPDEGRISMDPTSLNPHFNYTEAETDANGKERDKKHQVWFQDAVSVYNQLQIAKPMGIRGGALWFVGSEDPTLWSFYNKTAWNTDWTKIVDAGALNNITYGGQSQVDFEGDGELLQPLSPPGDGKRTVTRDPKTGLITAQAYVKDPATGRALLPSSWVVRRYSNNAPDGSVGNPRKQIVLTFDDGPDPTWTPQVLDILKQYNVPAVFFVVGREAEANPDLVRREWNEGHEIGNHSWSHPDLYRLLPEYQKLQLTSTQRIIQTITGHSTLLFRPPYGGDTEPQTGREVSPMQIAADLNYITVGEKNDPQDWRLFDLKPGTEAQDLTKPRDYRDIVSSVLANQNEGSVVLLHDAGGDRSRTLKALPEMIQQLRARGYTFVSISGLSGEPRAKLMPAVTGKDTLLVGADRYVFEVAYVTQRVLSTLFTLSILLGVSRVVLFVLLALIQRQREKRRVFPVGFMPSVSVIIAAYNEEKVIARTVKSILESGYPNLEIIVVDDGSKDKTSQVVQEAFAAEPRVRLLRKPNGGKASALNRGLQASRGEIMISLDADTLFASDTIVRLVRHFADSKVGAVSGNVRVGNANNILTRWQSLEYTTSQNFDRRGYDLLNCITVVPGAVGALRRDAVLAVGGYTHDTLAEDTDLTWKLRRAGWRITNDNSAMAYTEAPESLRNLARQRFRWAFGTLQCLWKHRAALGQHGAFGWLALPSLWFYQILFPAVSPFMDIAMIFSLLGGNWAQFATYYVAMFALELTAAFIALRMDKGNLRLLPWLFLQRFVYRQMMYYVILKSIAAAFRGGAVGWNKFERTGSARIETT